MKTQLQLYCRKHGFILVDSLDTVCPKCYPRRHVMQSAVAVAIPALGLGVAVGFGIFEVIRWVF